MDKYRIYRYGINRETPEWTVLPLRATSQILFVGARYNDQLPSVWVENVVDDDGEPIGTELPYTVAIHGTGHTIPDDGRVWIGSVVCGPFVWHVYGWHGDSAAPVKPYDFAPMKTAGTR